MYTDFIDGFEAAATLIQKHSGERPEDIQRYLTLVLRTLEEKRLAM
jgi:hypothetical protein